MFLIRCFISLWMMIGLVNGATDAPPVEFKRLPDGAMIPIPRAFKPCLDLLDNLPTLSYNQAVPLINEQWELIMYLESTEGPPNLLYIYEYAQTLIDEYQVLQKRFDLEEAKPESERCDEYNALEKAKECMGIMFFGIDAVSYPLPNPYGGLERPYTITSCFEVMPYSASGFVLPTIFSLNTHKLLFLSYIGTLLSKVAGMVNTVLDGIPITSSYIKYNFINPIEDGDKPFLEVFDRVHRDTDIGFRPLICGSKIFDYVRAIKPYLEFVDEKRD